MSMLNIFIQTNHLLFLFLSFQITKFEKLETDDERIKTGKDIYDQFIMKELLSQSHVSISTWNYTSCADCA